MPRYGIKKLIYIAENYEEFEPEFSHTNTIWASSRWAEVIDAKIDFDRALAQLTPGERKLVMSNNTSHEKERYALFRKMTDYLANPLKKQT